MICRRVLVPFCLLTGFAAGTVSAQYRTDSSGKSQFAQASQQIYRIKAVVNVSAEAAGAAWDLYNFSQIAKKDNSSVAEVESLKINKIDWFDRWAVHPYNHSVDKLSYEPFFLAMPFPLIVFGIDKKMRKDFWKLTFLYAEAMTMTGVLYTSAVHYVNRHRPLVYESASPIGTRTSPNSRNSFFAGHVALVGTSFFFVAQTYADYHPDSRYKWAFYGGAAALTALTGYWRNLAGEHFPTDITLGAGVGVASGLLTPALHRVKGLRNSRLSLLPFSAHGSGLTAFYRF
ncbi:MAG TPA: phosphatase PAP2 family protein [Puia sp.]|jgi:membrane-associated phospholipid phosphatase|nr:phosphatase PAP2 family protein [Puia sp.]